jgi:hypothetical protein
MRTPIAMTASNGPLAVGKAGVLERDAKLGVLLPRFRPPSRSVAFAFAWTYEPAITL